jgi:hypothetical protein
MIMGWEYYRAAAERQASRQPLVGIGALGADNSQMPKSAEQIP